MLSPFFLGGEVLFERRDTLQKKMLAGGLVGWLMLDVCVCVGGGGVGGRRREGKRPKLLKLSHRLRRRGESLSFIKSQG